MKYDPSQPITLENNAWSWDVGQSVHFPGEKTIACPKCGSVEWTLSVEPIGPGTGPAGRYRVGDPARDYVQCNKCGLRSYSGKGKA